jgi:hypothetical protein
MQDSSLAMLIARRSIPALGYLSFSNQPLSDKLDSRDE